MVNSLKILSLMLPLLFIAKQTSNATIGHIDVEIAEAPEKIYDKEFLDNVQVTMYHPVEGQTDSTPDVVADGSRFDIAKASGLKWIAVSRDLHRRWGGKLDFGDIVYLDIPGNSERTGYYLVKDTMNRRWKSRIDILETPGYPMYRHANVSLFVVKPNKDSKDSLWARHLGP